MLTISVVCLQLNICFDVSFFLQIESMDHCDFVPLRKMLIRTYLHLTNNVHYEDYRSRKLAAIVPGGSTDKIPNKVNKFNNQNNQFVFPC